MSWTDEKDRDYHDIMGEYYELQRTPFWNNLQELTMILSEHWNDSNYNQT